MAIDMAIEALPKIKIHSAARAYCLCRGSQGYL